MQPDKRPTKKAMSLLKKRLSFYELPNAYFLYGFLSAAASGYDLIMPGEWISGLGLHEVEYVSIEEADEVISILLAIFNDILTQLAHGTFTLFPAYLKQDIEDIEQATRDWAFGYTSETKWDSESWVDAYVIDRLLYPLMALQLSDEGLQELIDKEGIETTLEEFRQYDELVLSDLVNEVYRYWMTIEAVDNDLDNMVTEKIKIGRNERCPCGSGKKYKRCCLPVYH